MDHQHDDSTGGGRPPARKELQGPRPTPLKVRKESHKIKKPPVAPPVLAVQPYQQPPPQQPPRQPVIIYTVSPKVIHTHPSEFMTLVQRLTGPDPTSSSTSSSSSSSTSFQYPSTSSSVAGSSYHHVSGGISPAARLASIEKTKMPLEGKKFVGTSGVMGGEAIEIGGGDSKTSGGGSGEGEGGGLEGVERTVFFPGILSPGPGSLPPISPNLFSSFFQDPSPVQHGSIMRNYIEGNNFNIMPSPFSTNNLISPSTMFSPSSLELLHHILDN